MHILPPSASPDSALLLTAKGLRATADGFVSIILPAYLLLLGFGPLQIGLLATVALAGSAVVTLAVGHLRLGLTARGMLLLASGLMAVTGLNLGKGSMQMVGNMQQRNQVNAAINETLEEVISSTRFSDYPTNVFFLPCNQVANIRCVDIDGDGVTDVTVNLTPIPACLKAQARCTIAV